MAGQCSGAAARIKSQYPKALYVHCASHRLNLCVAASCRIPMIEDMMSQLCAVSDFFHQSPIRCAVLKEMIESLCPGADHTVVNNVCRTRWIARLDAFGNFCDLFPAISIAIKTVAKNVDGKYSQQIIVTVVIVKKFLSYTRGLTKKLQDIGRDLAKVTSDVKLLKKR